MITKPIVRFPSKTSLGIELVPKNSLVFVDDYNGEGNNRFFIVLDNSMMTNTSTIDDFLNLGTFKDIGSGAIDGPVGVQVRQYELISELNQTIFAIDENYINEFTMVFLNGVKLKRNQWDYLSDNSITLNIQIRKNELISIMAFSAPALPKLSRPEITIPSEADMGDEITITVTNWEGMYSTYVISYLTEVVDNHNGTFTGRLPLVSADYEADIRVQSIKAEFQDSPILVSSIINRFIAFTETFEMTINNNNISDITWPNRDGITTTGAALVSTELIKKIDINSNLSYESMLVTKEKIVAGDILIVDGIEIVILESMINKVYNSSTNIDDIEYSALIAKYELNGNVLDTTGKHIATFNGTEAYDIGKISTGAKFIGEQMGLNTYLGGIHLDGTVTRNKTLFSISCWIKGSGCIIQSDEYTSDQPSGNGYGSGWIIRTDLIGKAISRTTNKNFSWAEPTMDKFHHYYVSMDHNGLAKVYIDGAFVIEGDISGAVFYDGRHFANTGENIGGGYISYYSGIIDNIEIFNRELNITEIEKLAGVGYIGIDISSITLNTPKEVYYKSVFKDNASTIQQDVKDDTLGTIFKKISDGDIVQHKSKQSFSTVVNISSPNSFSTYSEIHDGDRLVIVKDDLSIVEVSASNTVISEVSIIDNTNPYLDNSNICLLKLDGDSIDLLGTHSGTDTGVIYNNTDFIFGLSSADFSVNPGSFIELSNPDDFKLSTCSISLSFKVDGFTGIERNIINIHNNNLGIGNVENGGLFIKLSQDSNEIICGYTVTEEEEFRDYLGNITTSNEIFTKTPFDIDVWNSLVVVYKENKIITYINGNKVNTIISKNNIQFSNTISSATISSATNPYNGLIGQVRVFNREIFQLEVKQLRVEKDKLYTLDTTLVTAGETPTRVFQVESKIEYKLGVEGWKEAIIKGNVYSYNGTNLLTERSHNEVLDITGSETLNTRVTLLNRGSSLTELKSVIYEDII